MASVSLNWGVAATGDAARGFVTDVALLPDCRVQAVGSRTQARADAFGKAHNIETRHPSYEALAADPHIDIVYVATPQSRHRDDVLMFLEAGKHVLCEKPMAVNATQTRSVASAARHHGLFLMEAMWSRFLPAYTIVRRILAEAGIGSPMLVDASFGFRAPFDADHRLFSRELGGGALLDLGIYPAQLASLVFGTPDRVLATGHVGPTGVDETCALALHHPSGGLATLRAAIRSYLPGEATISGTRGSIRIPAHMHCPDHVVVTTRRGSEMIDASFTGNGLRFQALEVQRCVLAGQTESLMMPLDETCALAETLDTAAVQIGVEYR